MRRGQQFDNERGLAKVIISKSKKGKIKNVVVTFKPSHKKGKPIQFTLDKKSVPECVLHKDFPSGDVFYADVDRTSQELRNLFPTQGEFQVRCIGFPHRDGEKPTYKTDSRVYGDNEVITQTMFAILEITSPDYLKGLTRGYKLRHDKFIDLDGTLGVAEEFHPQAVHANNLWKFLKLTGADKDGLPYKDNNLPQIDKLILKENREFMIYVKTNTVYNDDGTERNFVNIDSLQPLQDADDWGADYDDESIEESNDDWDESEEEELAEEGEW
jgi:hypothetical protein